MKALGKYLVTATLAALTCPAFAAEVRDQEKIVDVEKLQAALAKATEPIGQRIRASQLREAFAAVNEVLQQEPLDKRKLAAALDNVTSCLDTFTDNWDQVTAPLWEGQQSIAATIDKVRTAMARRQGNGAADEKTKAVLANYDKRLSDLAAAIKAEKDPIRQKRLTLLFSNVLALRKLTENSLPNLTDASNKVHTKLILALQGLEAQLTAATFQVEKARIILANQSEFVKSYADILKGAIYAEDLTRVLGELQGKGVGMSGMVGDLSELQKMVTDFNLGMEKAMDPLADSITEGTAIIEASIEEDSIPDVDVQKDIEKYYTAGSLSMKEDK